jgi:enediyne biosynthesis protein E4
MPDPSRRTFGLPLAWLATLGVGVLAGDGCRRDEADPGPGRLLPAATAVAIGPDAGPVAPGPARLRPAPDPVGPAMIRFRDVGATCGIDFVHVSGNGPEKHFPTGLGSGVAMIDYDGDGRLDLYFATTRELPLDGPTRSKGNRLYRNLGAATFEDVTERAGVGFRGFCHGVAVGDVDNDGRPDLYLANLGPNVLYLNNGDGTFRQAADFGAECRAWSTAAAFLDYDGDGLLDLYVSCYGRWTYGAPQPFCGDEARGVRIFCPATTIPPAHHFLFRNRGGGRFEEATERAGVLRRDGRGLGVVAVDVNRDGRADLYVANDMCPHFLFLNNGDGTFADVTDTSGAAVTESGHYQGGMGVDAEDLDGDGYPELFVTNFQGEYNTIHQSVDGRLFQDVSASAGIVRDSLPDVGWGCALADFDNDGRPDMLVVNGHVDDNLAALGREGSYAQRPKVWRNQGRGKFRLVADPGPFFAAGHPCRGAAFGDLDDDGDIDVVISRMDGRPAVLLNESDAGRWLRLELVGARSTRPPVGAAVEVHLGGRVLHRQVKGGGSYASANDPRLLIGVGTADRVDRVEVSWPSGRRSTLVGPALGRSYRVVEPAEGPEAGPARDRREGPPR